MRADARGCGFGCLAQDVVFQARQQHRPQLRAAGKPTSFLHKNAQAALACQLLEDGTKPCVTMMLVQHPFEVFR